MIFNMSLLGSLSGGGGGGGASLNDIVRAFDCAVNFFYTNCPINENDYTDENLQELDNLMKKLAEGGED